MQQEGVAPLSRQKHLLLLVNIPIVNYYEIEVLNILLSDALCNGGQAKTGGRCGVY